MKIAIRFIGLILIATLWTTAVAQSLDKGLTFTTLTDIKTTPVKDQFKSGTCWSFATTSFIETELIRMNKGAFDLSEIYFVRYAYADKADRYVRRLGNANFSEGGQAHDVMNVIRQHGFVMDSAYTGFTSDPNHIHGELNASLKAYIDVVKEKKNGTISPAWKDAFDALMDIYIGKLPSTVTVNDKTVDPLAFAKSSGFNPDDYIEITSYNHVPFYQQVMIDIPDNWSQDRYYNLPVDEMVEVIKSALKNNYSVCWDGDVSDKGFSHVNSLAISPEKKVTQEDRQIAFDNQQTTDDHLMHFTGIVTDQNGTIYFKTKNSWNANSNKSGGYLNMSEAYVRLNTIAIMVHKNALPKGILKKLNF